MAGGALGGALNGAIVGAVVFGAAALIGVLLKKKNRRSA